MNSSQFMDKQIMDLSQSQSNNDNDSTIFDLLNPPQEEKKHSRSINNNVSGVKKDDILPSYDFQPIRPKSGSGGSSSVNIGGSNVSGTRVWSSADSNPNSSARNHNYLDPGEATTQRNCAYDATILLEIDRTMKKHADVLLHSLEGVSARLSQMESRTRKLESLVDDLKVSVENNDDHDGKLRQLENILREVQSGVEALREKQQQRIAAPEAPRVEHNEIQSALPFQAVPSPVAPCYTPAASASVQIPPSSEHYYFPPPGQLPDPTQHYLLSAAAPPSHHHHHSGVVVNPPHLEQTQHYLLAAPPPTEPPQAQAQAQQQHHQQGVSAVVNPHLEQTHSPPPPGYQSYLRQSSLVTPQSEQYYGGGGGAPPPHYSMMMKQPQQQFPSSPSAPSSGSYPRLPTAPQVLPPTSGGGGGGGGRVPIDDVVEKVSTMGFSREQVRATVRKLTENGQSVDLNVVLDKLTNDPQNQPWH